MSASGYVITASARRDLRAVQEHLLQSTAVDTTNRLMTDFESAFLKLARAPGLGHPRPDLTDENLSFFRVHSWMVIYRPRTSPFRIIRVLHSARDIRELLG